MSDVLALMSRDDADELLVAQLGVFLLAAKHSETKADEYILQAAITNKAARLYILTKLGFADGSALQFVTDEALPLFENIGTVIEIVEFLKRYGPQLKIIIQTIVELMQLFKGIAPSVPAGEVGDGGLPKMPEFGV